MIFQKCKLESDKPGEAVCDFLDHRTAMVAHKTHQKIKAHLNSIFKGTVYPEMKILISSQTRMTSLLSGRYLAGCLYGIPVNVLMILNKHWSIFSCH